MSQSKSYALLLSFTVVLTGLSTTSLLQPSQAAYSQTDYEEYLITETNNEQNLNQKNIGSGSSTNINCGANLILVPHLSRYVQVFPAEYQVLVQL
jgi:hypothetical protein